MSKSMLRTALAVLLLGASAAGQQPAIVPGPKPVDSAARQPPPAANVRMEVTITDRRDGTSLPPKVVSLVVATGEHGRVRTGAGDLALNLDARPDLLRDGRMRVSLSLEYHPRRGESEPQAVMPLSESLVAILEDGKSLVVSQSADPASARTVSVEVKATLLK